MRKNRTSWAGTRHRCYEKDVKENTSNYNQSTYYKTKSTETYDRYWWWMVNGKIVNRLPPLRISTLSKKSQDEEDEIKNNI